MTKRRALTPVFFISWFFLLAIPCVEAGLRHFMILFDPPGATPGAKACVGAVFIYDYSQQVFADLRFQEAWVLINMNIESDEETISFTVNTQGQSIEISSGATVFNPDYLPLLAAIQAGAGAPSLWFSQGENTPHRFTVPKIEHPTDISARHVHHRFGGVKVMTPHGCLARWHRLIFRSGNLFMPFGSKVTGCRLGILTDITDNFMYQLIELLTVALFARQLIKGTYFPRTNPQKVLHLRARPHARLTWVPVHPVVRGYIMWTSDDGHQWNNREYYPEPSPEPYYDNPEGFSSTTTTTEGKELKCFLKPILTDPDLGYDSRFFNSQEDQMKYMLQNPPPFCRDGEKKPHNGKPDFDPEGGGAGVGYGGAI